MPVLSEFMSLHPNIELELHMTNRNINFAEEGFDIAIRGHNPPGAAQRICFL